MIPGTVIPHGRKVRAHASGQTWTIDGTVFEMWLNLPGSPKSVTARSQQGGTGNANAVPGVIEPLRQQTRDGPVCNLVG